MSNRRDPLQCSSLVLILHSFPCQVLTPPPSQPLPFPPYVRCSPSFHMPPKKTKTYTKSYKMPIQLVLVSFGKMHILHNYALLCIILNFLPLSEPIPIISQKRGGGQRHFWHFLPVIPKFWQVPNFLWCQKCQKCQTF